MQGRLSAFCVAVPGNWTEQEVFMKALCCMSCCKEDLGMDFGVLEMGDGRRISPFWYLIR